MDVIKIEKSLPKRETFMCDICGYERVAGAFNPLIIHKTAGDYAVSAKACRMHFGVKDGEIVHTLELLQLAFEVENKAKEMPQSSPKKMIGEVEE